MQVLFFCQVGKYCSLLISVLLMVVSSTNLLSLIYCTVTPGLWQESAELRFFLKRERVKKRQGNMRRVSVKTGENQRMLSFLQQPLSSPPSDSKRNSCDPLVPASHPLMFRAFAITVHTHTTLFHQALHFPFCTT